MFRLPLIIVMSALLACSANAEDEEKKEIVIDEQEIIISEAAAFRVEEVARGLEVPWSMEFLPGGDALISDRQSGRLVRLDVDKGTVSEITGLPEIFKNKKIGAGLFDARVDTNFANNAYVYVLFARGDNEASGLQLSRYKLRKGKLTDGTTLLQTHPLIKGKWHYGGRMAIKGEHIFITTGDGNLHPYLAQDLTVHHGKVLRIGIDGSVPKDNPFVEATHAMPEIWSFGIRSPQGLDIHPQSAEVWLNEHGPQGGDEVNIARAGLNYGWPVITYGEEYGGGLIGRGITHYEGMEQPVYYWRPSIGPSGMEFYQGPAFPGWNKSLFHGALALKHINRLVIEDNRVIHEERLLEDKEWRVRFIETGPAGMLYFGIDGGLILRLVPAGHG